MTAYAAPRTGKSLFALGLVQEYLYEGRHVVCNFPLNYDAIQATSGKRYKRARITICSPRPSSVELFALGEGYHPDAPHVEERGGLIVIDEAGSWIPARDWNHSDRAEIIRWFTLSGKLGWDVLLLTQTPELLDKLVLNINELFGKVMRTDRVKIPWLGIKLPRAHVATFRYGLQPNAIKCFSRMYRGNPMFKYFDTHFMFENFAPFSFFRPLKKYTQREIERMHLSSAPKHPLVARIQKLPPEQRLHFVRRFQACGALPC